MRATVEQRLDVLRTENAQKLDQMRATVDEKLQTTLDERLGQSFKQVSDRLDQVHKGLGEMQTLAVGVGDLKRVLTQREEARHVGRDAARRAARRRCWCRRNTASTSRPFPGAAERVEFAIRAAGTR